MAFGVAASIGDDIGALRMRVRAAVGRFFTTHFAGRMGGAIVHSWQYNMALITSSLFAIVLALYAMQFVGFIVVWDHPIANTLVWTILLGPVVLAYFFTFYLRDILVNMNHLASDLADVATPGNGDPYITPMTKAHFLSAALPAERKAIYLHMWTLMAAFFYGAGYLIVWWFNYHTYVAPSHLSNGYLIVEWGNFLMMQALFFLLVVYTSFDALSAYHRTYSGTMWSATRLISSYLNMDFAAAKYD